MKLFQGLFRRKNSMDNGDVAGVAQKVGVLLDHAASDIFLIHRQALLNEDIVYIVYAVWGAKKDGELNAEQLAINRKIAPVISKAKNMIGVRRATPQQTYAIESLIRSVLINRITFMIAHFRDTLCKKEAECAIGTEPHAPTVDDVDSWLSNLHVSENNPWWKRMRFNGGSFNKD